MILNGGNIPFIGNENEQIQENILHSSDNKFSILTERINNKGNNTSDDEREYNQWMEISDDLFDIISGLLTKDAKKRYTIDYILWNDWIPKMKYEFVYKTIIRYWLRRYRIKDEEDEIFACVSNHTAIANNIRQSMNHGQLSFHNESKSVIHQFKLHIYADDPAECEIQSNCHVTIQSNIWCKEQIIQLLLIIL